MIEPTAFREVLGQYPTGVCIVTATTQDKRPVGMAIGSFSSVSLSPPLVAFMPDKRSDTWPEIRAAGAFCVNVLAADQEYLCRRFAAKGKDRFEGLRWTETGTGSPLIEGAVAWIDCELERVDEAGDHFIVLGAVRALEGQGSALPLLFFRGGYGAFAPLSLAAATADDYAELLRVVDVARPIMESLGRALDAECVAWGLLEDEVVSLAAVWEPDSPRTPPTPVGARIPAIPPFGLPMIASQEKSRIERWLDHAESPTARDAFRKQLIETRTRGYSVTLNTPGRGELASLLHRQVLPPASRLSPAERELLGGVAYDPPDFDPDQPAAVDVIVVPVFGPDRKAVIGISIRDFSVATRSEFDSALAQLQGAADRVTAMIGGHPPVNQSEPGET